MRIRDYKDKDYNQVAEVWRSCFTGKLRPIDSRETVRRVIKRSPRLFLVAEEKGKIIGTVYVTYDGRQAVIHRLAVLPRNQKRGVGKKLLLKLMPRIMKLRPIEILTHAAPAEHVVNLYAEVGMKRQKAVYMKKKVY